MRKSSLVQPNLLAKLEQIKTGAKQVIQKGVKENKNIVQGKGGKYAITEKEEKFEETGVRKKKKNYVLYESKLGTNKVKDLKKIAEAPPKPKPKPKPQPRARVEEKIIQQRKRKEYLDNYQYKETKVIKKNKRISTVIHQRLGEIFGGFYDEVSYSRLTMSDPGTGFRLNTQEGSTRVTSSRLNSNTITNTLPGLKYGQGYSTITTVRGAPKKETISTRNTRTEQLKKSAPKLKQSSVTTRKTTTTYRKK